MMFYRVSLLEAWINWNNDGNYCTRFVHSCHAVDINTGKSKSVRQIYSDCKKQLWGLVALNGETFAGKVEIQSKRWFPKFNFCHFYMPIRHIMLWLCPSVCLSLCLSESTCFRAISESFTAINLRLGMLSLFGRRSDMLSGRYLKTFPS